MHRRRVYVDRGSRRKAKLEGFLSLSIFLSAATLFLSLLGCWPDVLYSTASWFLPDSLSDRFGFSSQRESSVLALLCEILMTVSGAYLLVALFIKSHTK
jgi:hypothetical protein